MVEQYDNATFNTKVKIARARAPLLAQLEAKDAEIANLTQLFEKVDDLANYWANEAQSFKAENVALREKIAGLDEIFTHIEVWTEAYPEEVPFFAPLSDDEIKACVKAMIEHSGIDAPSDRMHASWARHIVKNIQEHVDAARALLKETGEAPVKAHSAKESPNGDRL